MSYSPVLWLFTWESKTFNVFDVLSYPMPNTGSTMVAPVEKFQLKVLRRLENAILRLVFANAVFQECHFTDLF